MGEQRDRVAGVCTSAEILAQAGKKKNPNQAVQGYKRKEAEEKESSFREEADAKEHKSGMNSTCLSPNGIADRFHSYQEKVAGNSRKRLTENFL